MQTPTLAKTLGNVSMLEDGFFTYSQHFATKGFLKKNDGRRLMANMLVMVQDTRRWSAGFFLKWVASRFGITVQQPVTGALHEAETTTQWVEEVASTTEVIQKPFTTTCIVNPIAMANDSGLTVNGESLSEFPQASAQAR